MNESVDVDREVQRLMAEVREQQVQLEAAQATMQATQIIGSAERGLVEVVLHGGGRISSVIIHPDAMRQFDAHTLGNVVLEAIHDAMGQLVDLTRDTFAPLMPDPSALDDAFTYWDPSDQPVDRR